jgi:hypothetical protein
MIIRDKDRSAYLLIWKKHIRVLVSHSLLIVATLLSYQGQLVEYYETQYIPIRNKFGVLGNTYNLVVPCLAAISYIEQYSFYDQILITYSIRVRPRAIILFVEQKRDE